MMKLVTTIREYTEYKVLHRRVLVSVKSGGHKNEDKRKKKMRKKKM